MLILAMLILTGSLLLLQLVILGFGCSWWRCSDRWKKNLWIRGVALIDSRCCCFFWRNSSFAPWLRVCGCVCVPCVCSCVFVWFWWILLWAIFLGPPLLGGAVRYGSAALSGKQSCVLWLLLFGFQWVCLFLGRLVLVRSTLV